MHLQSFLFLFSFIVLNISCHKNSGSSKSTEKAKSQPSAQAETLVIGNSVVGELSSNLIQAGLSKSQATIITAGSTQDMNIAAGKIDISSTSLHLTDVQPIVVVATPIITGAIRQLTASHVDLDDATKRLNIAKVIVKSVFSSLGGRTSTLSNTTLLALEKSMIQGAVEKLTAANLSGQTTPKGLEAVTSGAVEAFPKAGISPKNVVESASTIAQGSVESIKTLNVADAVLGDSLGGASGGIIASLAKAGVTSANISSAAGSLSKTTVESLKSLSLKSNLLLVAAQGVANGSVGALTKAGVSPEQIGAAAQQITTGSVSGLTNAGAAAEDVGNLTGAIATGAIKGLVTAGLTAEQIIQTKAIASVVSGAASAIASTGVSSQDTAAAMGSLAGAAVGAIASAGFTSSSQLNSALADVVGGTIQGSQDSVKNDTTLTAAVMSSVSQKTVEALPQAGFKAADVVAATSVVVQTGMSKLTQIGVTDASLATSIAAKITQGAMSGTAKLATSGVITAEQTNAIAVSACSNAIDELATLQKSGVISAANDIANFSGSIAQSAMTGLSFGGASSSAVVNIQAGVTSAVSGNAALAKLQITDAMKQQITSTVSTSTTNAVSIAKTVDAGFPACTDAFADSLSDSAFWVKVDAASPPIMCTVVSGSSSCPASRQSSGRKASWQISSVQGACELVATGLVTVTPSTTHVSVSPGIAQSIASGSTQAFTVTADTGYTLSTSVGGTCAAGTWSSNVYTTGIITANCGVSFSASLSTYTVIPSATHATTTPNSAQVVNSGATLSFTMVPDKGYALSDAVGGTCSAGSWKEGVYTTGSVTADCTISFAATLIPMFTVTPSVSHVSITPNAATTLFVGTALSYTVTADTGYVLSNTVGGTCPTGSWVTNIYTTGAILSDCTVNFSATANTYTVSATGVNVTISPSTDLAVTSGSTQTYTVTGNTGFIASSTVGGSCPKGSWNGTSYTTGSISAGCTVNFSANVEYAYIIDYAQAYYIKCNVSSVDGTLSNCSQYSVPGTAMIDIGFNNGYAYILNFHSQITQCTIATGGVLINCTTTAPMSPLPNNVATSSLLFYGGFAYILNGDSGPISSYDKCEIGSAGVISNCTSGFASPDSFTTPGQMVVHNGYFYAANFYGQAKDYLTCTFDSSGNLTNCHDTIPASPGALYFPCGVAVNGNYLYFSNAADGDRTQSSYTYCGFGAAGALTNCKTVIPASPGALNGPYGMAFMGPYAYFIDDDNSSGSYTKCSTNTDGSLTNCNTSALSAQASTPLSIRFYP